MSAAASGCVCFFLYLRVSVRLCVSIYVGLSRRAQCDKRAGGGVGKRKTFQRLSSPPQGHQDAGIYVLAHVQI